MKNYLLLSFSLLLFLFSCGTEPYRLNREFLVLEEKRENFEHFYILENNGVPYRIERLYEREFSVGGQLKIVDQELYQYYQKKAWFLDSLLKANNWPSMLEMRIEGRY